MRSKTLALLLGTTLTFTLMLYRDVLTSAHGETAEEDLERQRVEEQLSKEREAERQLQKQEEKRRQEERLQDKRLEQKEEGMRGGNRHGSGGMGCGSPQRRPGGCPEGPPCGSDR